MRQRLLLAWGGDDGHIITCTGAVQRKATPYKAVEWREGFKICKQGNMQENHRWDSKKDMGRFGHSRLGGVSYKQH